MSPTTPITDRAYILNKARLALRKETLASKGKTINDVNLFYAAKEIKGVMSYEYLTRNRKDTFILVYTAYCSYIQWMLLPYRLRDLSPLSSTWLRDKILVDLLMQDLIFTTYEGLTPIKFTDLIFKNYGIRIDRESCSELRIVLKAALS